MCLSGKPPRESRVEMVDLVLPNHANLLGNIVGGRVMYLIDIAGGLAASRHCRRVVVTASMDSLDFLRPIKVGDAIILHAWVNYTARTSMEVEVRVYAENLMTGRREHTSTALLTFVALDDKGRPTEVPPLLPETEEEWERYRAGEARRQERLKRIGRLRDGGGSPAGENRTDTG